MNPQPDAAETTTQRSLECEFVGEIVQGLSLAASGTQNVSSEKSKVHEGCGETYVWCMTPVTSGTNAKPTWKFPRASQSMQRKMGEKAQETHLVPI